MESNIKDRWKQICDEYALMFANKHGYDIQYELEHGYLWIANKPGTVCEMADLFIGMEDIIYDIDNEIPEDKFEKWYWKNLDVYELANKNWLTYEAYCKGATDNYTDETLEKIRAAKKRVEESEEELKKLIEKYDDKRI